MSDIVLKVNGKSYSGWTDGRITQSLDQLCGAFSFNITNPYPNIPSGWKIHLGDRCTVEINGQTVITGFIDEMPISYTHSSSSISISGRDVTCDLIDCSFIETPKEWKNQSISNIVNELCKPFNIDVIVDDSVLTTATQSESVFTIKTTKRKMALKFDSNTAKMRVQKVGIGEKVFDIINRICRTQAILPISYGDGKLTLTRTGNVTTHDSLKLGINIKSGRLNQNNKDRYSLYIVKGQKTSDPFEDILSYTEPSWRFEDKVINRYRPTTIMSQSPVGTDECEKTAKWEASTRAGRSRSVEYEVQGWTQSNGDIWSINTMVGVNDSQFNIKTYMLISKVEFSISASSGSITKLTLVDPAAYELAAQDFRKAVSKDDAFAAIDWEKYMTSNPYNTDDNTPWWSL